MTQEWQRHRERGTVFWLHVITWIALNIGWKPAHALLYPITAYFFATGRATRAASRKFLTIVLGRRPTLAETFAHQKTFASTILHRVYLLRGDVDRFDIRLSGAEPVLEHVANRRGCILVGSHLGSFEILRVLGAHHANFDLKVLMNEDQNRAITRFLNRFNPGVANTVIGARSVNAVLQIDEAIKDGALVALMGDRVHGGDKLVRCEFLGEPARFPITAASLGLTIGAPVFLVFGLYRGGNRYDILFEPLGGGQRMPRPARRAEAERLTCEYARRLGVYARKAPYNWFNFYDFWKLD